MERRKFLLGAGSTAIGASALIGSGAYSMVWANRDVKAEVTGDSAANLGFEVKKSEFAGYDGNQFYLDIDSLNEDANSRFYNVFWIRNNGTNDISVEAHELDGDGNLDGWNQDALALYWSQGNLPEDGSQFGSEDGLMHQDEPFDQIGGPDLTRNIPRLSPGEAISVHPAVLLQENTSDDTDVRAIPSEIGFYATVTNL